jgi:hypothetical protein
MQTKDLTDTQLYEYFAEHVRYEIQLLLNAAWAISNKLKVPQGLEYMPVEAYAIHMRNLITFLYPPASPRKDDVCAKHFFIEETKWDSVRPGISQILIIARTRAHKEIGHLTTSRHAGTPKGKEWDIRNFTAELMPVIETFSETADRVILKECTEPLLAAYKKIAPHLI